MRGGGLGGPPPPRRVGVCQTATSPTHPVARPGTPAIAVSEPSSGSTEKALIEPEPLFNTYRKPLPSDTSRSTGPGSVAPLAPSPTSESAPSASIAYWLTFAEPALAVYAKRPSDVTTSQHASAWLLGIDALIGLMLPASSTS
jgi:hypothetical protein